MLRKGSWGKINWIVARVTAVLIMIFVVDVSYFWLSHQHVSFTQWDDFFDDKLTVLLFFCALVSILFHAWIGVWTVLTDYIKNKTLQGLLEVLFVLFLCACLFCGFYLLGG